MYFKAILKDNTSLSVTTLAFIFCIWSSVAALHPDDLLVLL